MNQTRSRDTLSQGRDVFGCCCLFFPPDFDSRIDRAHAEFTSNPKNRGRSERPRPVTFLLSAREHQEFDWGKFRTWVVADCLPGKAVIDKQLFAAFSNLPLNYLLATREELVALCRQTVRGDCPPSAWVCFFIIDGFSLPLLIRFP